jgi:hypothetical protein
MRLKFVPAVATLAVSLVVASTQTAQAEDSEFIPPTDEEVISIYEQASSVGAVSEEQRQRLLLRQDADLLIDPINVDVNEEPVGNDSDQIESEDELEGVDESVIDTPIISEISDINASSESPAPGASGASTTKCVKKDRYVVYKSLTGSKLVEYHFTVSWCYNGSKITNTPVPGHYIVRFAPAIEDRGFTNNPKVEWTRANHFSAALTLQGKVAQCLGDYICFPAGQPLTKWGVYGNGNYTYSVTK